MNKKLDVLRENAKVHVADTSVTSPDVVTDPRQHELDILQVELEMQNEELRLAQVALEESRDYYINLYEFSPIAYLTLTAEGRVNELNITCAKLLGIERNNLLNQLFTSLVAPQDRDCWYLQFRSLLRHQQEDEHSFELMLLRSPTGIFHAQLNCLFMVSDTQVPMLRITLTDITQQKQAEEMRRDLSSHLEVARENERTRIAREIHDELGSVLVALKMDVSWLAKQLPADLSLCHQKTNVINKHIDDAIASVRKIIADLRPSILDHLGLFAAIDWKIDEFRRQTGMHCAITLPEQVVIDERLSVTVFRVMQEALTNIAVHSRATRVRLDVAINEQNLIMTIADNGEGMTQEQLSQPGRYGVLGMQERAGHFGGSVMIDSQPGKGTRLVLNMPLKSTSASLLQRGTQDD